MNRLFKSSNQRGRPTGRPFLASAGALAIGLSLIGAPAASAQTQAEPEVQQSGVEVSQEANVPSTSDTTESSEPTISSPELADVKEVASLSTPLLAPVSGGDDVFSPLASAPDFNAFNWEGKAAVMALSSGVSDSVRIFGRAANNGADFIVGQDTVQVGVRKAGSADPFQMVDTIEELNSAGQFYANASGFAPGVYDAQMTLLRNGVQVGDPIISSNQLTVYAIPTSATELSAKVTELKADQVTELSFNVRVPSYLALPAHLKASGSTFHTLAIYKDGNLLDSWQTNLAVSKTGKNKDRAFYTYKNVGPGSYYVTSRVSTASGATFSSTSDTVVITAEQTGPTLESVSYTHLTLPTN